MKGASGIIMHIQARVTICAAEILTVPIKLAMPLSYSHGRNSFELADLLDLTRRCVLQKRPLPGVGGADQDGR